MSVTQESTSRIRTLRENPNFFVRRVLQHDPWEIPEQIARDLSVPRARVAVKACHSSGKCVAANERVLLADGSRPRAMDLIGTTFQVLTPTPDGMIPADAKAEWNLIEQVISITTRSGRKIIRNGNHPLYVAGTIDATGFSNKTIRSLEWVEIEDIVPGQYVAVPYDLGTLKLLENPSISDEDIRFLAFMTGGIGISGYGPNVVDVSDKCYAAIGLFCEQAGVTFSKSDVTRFHSVPFEIVSEDHKIISLLDEHGLIGSNKENIRVPDEIFRQPILHQALFLSHLYSFGGYLDHVSRYRIGYYSFSEELVRDVQHLLLVQGIPSIVEKIDSKVWRVQIDQAAYCLEFVKNIGIFGQEEVCMRALRWLTNFVTEKDISKSPHMRKRMPILMKGLMWDEVVSIDLEGVKATVAIEVPYFETFITSFWEHNTHTAADLVLWFTSTGGKTLSTAPSWKQVEKLLWGEIHRTFDVVGHTLGGQLLQTEYRITSNAYAFGISTDQGVQFQGHHDSGGGVLIVIDEAPGVRPDIWEAIEGIRAGGDVRILALGNPVLTGGPFYDAFGKDKKLWKTYTISAFDTPNLKGYGLTDLLRMSPKELDENPRPYLVTKKWVVEKYYQWGPGDPRWSSRILGEFPAHGTHDLLSQHWIDEAEKKVYHILLPDQLQAGVDVAGAGADQTVVTVRKGDKVMEIGKWSEEDPREEVKQFLNPWRERDQLLVVVDTIGIGHYFVKYLEDNDFLVVAMNVSQAPIDDVTWIWDMDVNELPTKRFANLKAQLYWGLRERFQNGRIANLYDDEARSQLKTIQWKEIESNGKIAIESKESMKKRGIDSPDVAESIMLSFAEVGINIPQIPLVSESIAGWGF